MENVFNKINLRIKDKISYVANHQLASNLLLLTVSLLLLTYHLTTEPSSIKDFIYGEDGILESLSAIFYFLASLFFLMGARTTTAGYKRWMYWCLFLCVLLFVVGGEEISWGQRIFGIVTPEQLSEVNVQQEFNFHNIDGIHQNIRFFGVLFVFVFCYLIPLSNCYSDKLHSLYQRWQLPIFPASSIMIVTIATSFMIFPRLLIDQAVYSLFETDEIGEFYLSLAWLIFSIASWNRSLSRNKHLVNNSLAKKIWICSESVWGQSQCKDTWQWCTRHLHERATSTQWPQLLEHLANAIIIEMAGVNAINQQMFAEDCLSLSHTPDWTIFLHNLFYSLQAYARQP